LSALSSFINRPVFIFYLVGFSSFFTGCLFFPIFPWYILGDVKEAEIGSWGLLSMVGGAASIAGATAIKLTAVRVQKALLLLSFVGLALLILAQVPALLMWLFYGGVFTRHWMPWATLGMAIGITLHVWIGLAALTAMVSAGKALRGGIEPGLKLSRRAWLSFAGVLLLVLGALWGWEEYQNRHWIASISPVDGVEEVPLNTKVSVTWKGSYDSMGMRIDYVDEPDLPTPGGTAASQYGISFTPEQPYLPGRKVKVTVEAGRRSHTFTFTTAQQ
jgi:succinate dehydrogenase hydrophobic anchor subunit